MRFIATLLVFLLFSISANATNICSVSITTAVTGSAQTPQPGFGKPQALTVQAKFTYVASAATNAAVYLQTTVDGIQWMDIANFLFTTTSVTQYVNLSGMTTVTTPVTISDGSLASNTTVQGALGALYRCKLTTTGTYGAGTTVSIDVLGR